MLRQNLQDNPVDPTFRNHKKLAKEMIKEAVLILNQTETTSLSPPKARRDLDALLILHSNESKKKKEKNKPCLHHVAFLQHKIVI
jgi:catechol-2,3-dioxygenase